MGGMGGVGGLPWENGDLGSSGKGRRRRVATRGSQGQQLTGGLVALALHQLREPSPYVLRPALRPACLPAC